MYPAHYLHIFPNFKGDEALLLALPNCSTMLMPEKSLDAFLNGLVPEGAAQALSRAGFMVADPEQEKERIHSYIEELNKINRTLRVSVILNLTCNFSCSYCYEGSMKGDHQMDLDTADRLIEYLQKKYDERRKEKMILDLYGGEPLLSVPLIKYIAGKLQPWVEKRGGKFEFTLVTNGSLLTRPTVERLLEFGLDRARVTIDGPAANHNQYRPFKNGGASYETIVNNLLAVHDLIKVAVGGNFTEANYRMFPEMLDDLIAAGLTPDKLHLVRLSPVTNTSGEFAPRFSEGCQSITEPWLAEANLFLREEILKRGFQTPKPAPAICMIDVDDSFVIHYDGSLYKCPGLIGQGQFAIGHIENGNFDYRRTYNLDNWRREEKCRECRYLPLCFGGCRYSRYQRVGEMSGVECMKDYLDKTLEEMLRQDFKYRQPMTAKN